MTTYLLDSNIFIQAKNACLGMNVRYVTPFAMLRAEKARFVLPSPSQPKAA
jgi:hypothetical protein